METNAYHIPPPSPVKKTKTRWILVISSLLFAGVTVFLYAFFMTDFFKQEQMAPANFSAILKEDEAFKFAIENIRSGKVVEGRNALEDNIANIQQPEIIGVYQLWIANSFRFEDPKQYAQKMTSVATGPLFDKRTRLYAYAFLGDFYSAAPGNEVLDIIVNEESLKAFQARNIDGSLNYRLTFSTILQNATQTLGDNPLVLARTASIVLGGLRSGDKSVQDVFSLSDIDTMIARAIPLENDLFQTDTQPLYSSYIFLLAQVVGGAKLEARGQSLATIDTLNIGDLYTRAINTSSTGNKPIEASARINYVVYLIENYEQNGENKEGVLEKIAELMKRFEQDNAFQDTPVIQFFVSAKSRGDSFSYKKMQKIAEYSTVFADLMKSKGAL